MIFNSTLPLHALTYSSTPLFPNSPLSPCLYHLVSQFPFFSTPSFPNSLIPPFLLPPPYIQHSSFSSFSFFPFLLFSFFPFFIFSDKNEWVCGTCGFLDSEDGTDLVLCDGPCLGSFHLGCLDSITKKVLKRLLDYFGDLSLIAF